MNVNEYIRELEKAIESIEDNEFEVAKAYAENVLHGDEYHLIKSALNDKNHTLAKNLLREKIEYWEELKRNDD